MKKLRWILGSLAALLLAIQLVPVERTNPPVEAEVDAPPAVLAVLQRACYDCHSNQTVWPWYSRVAPVSWLVASDVAEGREHVNFTTWNRLDPEQRADAIHDVGEEVSEGEMPLWYYLPLHPSARLSEAERSSIRQWTGVAGESGPRRDDDDDDDDD